MLWPLKSLVESFILGDLGAETVMLFSQCISELDKMDVLGLEGGKKGGKKPKADIEQDKSSG